MIYTKKIAENINQRLWKLENPCLYKNGFVFKFCFDLLYARSSDQFERIKKEINEKRQKLYKAEIIKVLPGVSFSKKHPEYYENKYDILIRLENGENTVKTLTEQDIISMISFMDYLKR